VSRQDSYTITLDRGGDGTLAGVRLDVLDGDGRSRSIRLGGGRVEAVTDPLRRVLAEAGVRGRTWTGSAPIAVATRPGERVELLLSAVKPLRRPDRIAAVAEQIVSMGAEEASYWHAKTSRPGGLRAMRILLTGGGR
jgi:hypothetical protein